MVLKRSNFPKNLEHISRGIFIGSGEGYFKIKFTNKQGKIKSFELKESDYFEKPEMKTGVLCKYDNSNKKEIKEIYTLDGKFVYRKKDF